MTLKQLARYVDEARKMLGDNIEPLAIRATNDFDLITVQLHKDYEDHFNAYNSILHDELVQEWKGNFEGRRVIEHSKTVGHVCAFYLTDATERGEDANGKPENHQGED